MNTIPTEIIVARYYARYYKQIKKEQTMEIVKGLMTTTALLVTFICLFLILKAK